jgi:microcystin-dependent protein
MVVFPGRFISGDTVSEPFVGEIKLFSFPFAPRNWAFCNGTILSIAQNQALFALLGTTYGGNGIQTFALPDLRGRIPVHRSNDGSFQLGQTGGEESVTLSQSAMPIHNHLLLGTTAAGDKKIPKTTLGASPVATNSAKFVCSAAASLRSAGRFATARS